MRPHRLRRPRVCLKMHSLRNGEASCNDRGCNLSCNPGYVFGNDAARAQTVALQCDVAKGYLMMEGKKWLPESTQCTPTMCATPCLNGGTCVARNRCACTGAFTGDTCAKDIMIGDQPYRNYYPGPLASNQRRVECEPGTRMTDGSTSVTLTYKDKVWFFPDGNMMIGLHQVECHKDNASDAATPPSLQGLQRMSRFQRLSGPPQTQYAPRSPCSAPCLNKGVCQPNGTCTCRSGYTGQKCEQRICGYPRFENGVNAVPVGTLKRLTFQCRAGRRSPRGDGGVTVVCVGGVWQLEDGRVLTEDAVKCTMG